MNAQDRLAMATRHPLDFTIQYPPRREYFQENFRATRTLAPLQELGEVLLYVHVPFCEAKCFYCNFAVDVRRDSELHAKYVTGIETELARLADLIPSHATIPGIDIGGGTPTLLPAHDLARLVGALAPWRARCTRARPLSIETTPRIAACEPEKIAILADGGVERVSVGLQSTNDDHLKNVNRSAQRELGELALRNLRASKMARVNVDLIFALPGQTRAHWLDDLARVTDAGVDSITTYDCLYRGKGRALTRRTPSLPTQDVYRELYDTAYEFLTSRGYHAPYGSVNYSQHAGETGTSAYYEGRLFDALPYIGVGNYASSMLGSQWWFAPYGVNEWLRAVDAGERLPVGVCYDLPLREQLAKQILLMLNFGRIDDGRVRAAFGASLMDILPDKIAFALGESLLIEVPGGWSVAPGGFGRLPELRALFYSDDAMAWLLNRETEMLAPRAAATA